MVVAPPGQSAPWLCRTSEAAFSANRRGEEITAVHGLRIDAQSTKKRYKPHKIQPVAIAGANVRVKSGASTLHSMSEQLRESCTLRT
jgi:hypothetical protein